jgi:hypothetical protein
MSEADSAASVEQDRWLAEHKVRDNARREKFKLITQHTKGRDVASILGGEDFTARPRNRFDCMAVVRGAAWAAICVRTRYGDAVISRMQTGEWCYSLDKIIEKHNSAGAWIAQDQIWLSRDEWGHRCEDWTEAADYVCCEEVSLIRGTPIHMVGLDTIEESFDMPVTRIADAAREGRLGRIQDLVQLDRAFHAKQREDLSNIEAFALAMCVYAQAGGE